MLSNTVFLEPDGLVVQFAPTWASATGTNLIFDNNQIPLGAFVSVKTNVIVNQGQGLIKGLVEALLINQPTVAELLTETIGISLDNPRKAFNGSGSSTATVIATFSVDSSQTFTFSFLTDIALEVNEIETPNQDNFASSGNLFLLLDVSNSEAPELVDYLSLSSTLISSQQTWELTLDSSENFNLTLFNYNLNIDGDDEVDFLLSTLVGNYENTFLEPTELMLLAISDSLTKFAGDKLIGRLGLDVIYGTVWEDELLGTKDKDKLYGSLGDDSIYGGDKEDIIEGGGGNDWLSGGKNKDKLNGSSGDDYLDGGDDKDELYGGLGNDTLFGGEDDDKFIFVHYESLDSNEYDVVKDFEVGKDEVEFHHWGSIDIMTEGEMTQTAEGVIFTVGDKQKILFEGLTSTELQEAFQQKKKMKGTDEDDNLFGGLGDDEIKSEEGNDVVYGYSGNDKLEGQEGDDFLSGGYGEDELKGDKGNDTLAGDDNDDKLEGKEGNDVLIGGEGNDEVKGGEDNDRLTGVNPYQPLAGVGEIDKLKGEKGADLFILGDQNQVYYDDGNSFSGGFQDYALIEDFKASDSDRIQLHGSFDNYSLGTMSGDFTEGTGIFWELGEVRELIAILKKVSLEDISSQIFTFT